MALQFEWKHSPGVLAGLGVRLKAGQRELLEADEACAIVPWAVPDPWTIWEGQGSHLKDPCTQWQSNVIPVLLHVRGDEMLTSPYIDSDECAHVSDRFDEEGDPVWREFPSVIGQIDSHPLEDQWYDEEFPDLFRIWDAIPCTLDQGLALQAAGRAAFEQSLWWPTHELFGLENFGTHSEDREEERRKELEAETVNLHSLPDLINSHPGLTPAEKRIWRQCLDSSRQGWDALAASQKIAEHHWWYAEKERNPWY